METQVESIARAQTTKWERLQCERVWERGTVRLPQFKKNFAHNTPVTVRDHESGEWRPYLLRSGRVLRAAEVMPERADLALDKDGHLLDQHSFETNYATYLDTFIFPPGSELQYEPIPNVARFVNAKMDQWGESRGTVEIDYDPKLDVEFKPKHLIDADGEKAEMNDIKSLLAQLARLQIGANEVAKSEEPEGIPLEQVAKSSEPAGEERAPCGKFVKEGYVKQHQRHCKSSECGPDSVNSKQDEAA